MFARKSLRSEKLKKIKKTQLKASKRKPFLEQLEQRLLLNSDWQNPARRSDVNNDMMISPIDALIVINKLNQMQPRGLNLGQRTNALDFYPDVSGDSALSALDALLVINTLNHRQGNNSGVPERLDGEAYIAPAGFISVPMAGLPGNHAQLVDVAMQMTISREEFNEMGLFVVDGPNGAVNGVLPTAPNYPAVVFESVHRQVIYSRLDLFHSSKSVTFPGGSYLAVYILQSSSDNGDSFSHIRVKADSNNRLAIGWEEHVAISPSWPMVGDRSYDDATVAVQISAPHDGNAIPAIRNIPNQAIDELRQLSIQTIVVDADLPDDRLTYSIQTGPSGAKIDRDTGLFTWTPTEAQGPGVFPVTLKVTDASGAVDTEFFNITVNEINLSPVLEKIVDQQVEAAALVSFTATSTDPDFPANSLRYSLGLGAPAGASIDPITGKFQWIPTESQNAQTFIFSVRVTDSGTPALTAEQPVSFTVGTCQFAAGFTGVTSSESGGSSQGKGAVATRSCVATLIEGDSFVVLLQADFTVPAEPSFLEFDRSNLWFDATDNFINDAFEAALVNEQGVSLVHRISGSRDAFFNITEGQEVQFGANTKLDGDTVKVDLEHLAPGTKARLLLRLINNDTDVASSIQIANVELVNGSLGTPLSISGETSEVPRASSSIDFASLKDVSNSMSVEYGRTSFEQEGELLQVDLAIRNLGSYSLNHPLIVAVDRISDPTIRVINADGVTPAGLPYFDLSLADASQLFNPLDVTGSRQLLFRNPGRMQFEYDLVVLSQLNRSPVIVSEAVTEAFVGRPYSYKLDAIDPDGDTLSYVQLTGPANALSGNTFQWTPTGSDRGTHTLSVRVNDGRGGTAQQQFTLTVSDPPPNRPPVFTSTPVVDSNFGKPYVYDANARDEDGDPLSYSLVAGAEGMSVDKATGVVSWIPNASLGTAQEKLYTSIDLSPFANSKLSDLANTTPNYPTGSFQPFGVPFFIPRSGQNVWHSLLASGTNPRVLEIPVSVTGATAVHTLINTYWGQGGPASYSYAEFFGSGGAYFRKDLIGNEDVRDYLQNTYTNHINGSTSRAAFSEIATRGSSAGKEVRLDEQRIALPPAFLGQALERMRLVDNGGDGIQRIFVSGVTVESSVDVVAKRPVSIAVEDGRGGSATQSFVIDIQPTLGNHNPAIVSTPNVSKIDLLRNGSFEAAAAGNNDGAGRQVYIAGTHNNSIANWTLEGSGDVYIHKSPDIGTAIGSTFNSARTGNQYLDLSGGVGGGSGGNHATIYQTFATIPSTKYELKFFIGAAFAPAASINVRIDGASSIVNETFTANAPSSSINWIEKVVSFVADSTTTKLSFRDTTRNDDNVSFVDDVSVTVESAIAYANAQSFSYVVQAVDADNDALSYFIAEGPQRMTIDSRTGKLEWSPGTADVGNHSVLVRVQDGRGGIDTQQFLVHVAIATPGEIRGTIYNDLNGNGIRDGFNVLKNKDFESGVADFTSDLLNVSPGVAEGAYVVGSNPKSFNINFGSFGDHTTGSGQMMIINGAPDSDGIVWAQEITVNPNTQYQFGLWAASAYAENPASLQFYVNEELIGPSLSLTSEVGKWQFLSATWNSAGSTSVKVALRNHVGIRAGNDFVIDDIEFRTLEQFEPGLADRIVYLDANQNNIRDPGESFTTTDSQGNYSFANLLPGTYVVREETLPDWLETFPGEVNRVNGSNGPVNYVNWTSADVAKGTASGVITLPGGSTVNVELQAVFADGSAGSLYFASTDGVSTNYWQPSSPYVSDQVSNPPPDSDIIALIGGENQIYRVRLSEPIVEPIMSIVSLGSTYSPTTYDFDSAFDIVSQGTGSFGGTSTSLTQLPGNILQGSEGNGTIKFQGTFSSFSWKVPTPELWHGFTFGIRNSYALSRGGFHLVDLASGEIETGKEFGTQKLDPNKGAEIRGMKFHDLNGDGVRTVISNSFDIGVPGTSDPWLAGMPDGSSASNGDVAPAQSPVAVDGLVLKAGAKLTFQVSGSVNYVSSPSGNPPDGDLGFFVAHANGVQNGISNIIAPVNSLVALFLGPDQPDQSPAPAILEFQPTGNVAGGTDYLTLYPQLKQVFFVGDGLGKDGLKQQIIVPQGATRLFLGTMDGQGWFNNSGAFAVTVNAVQSEPGLRDWTIYLDQNTNGLRDSNEPSTVTDSKGEYAFTNLAPDTYVVAEEYYPTYDAVRDFTTDANPNSPWTYGFTQTRSSTFQQSTITGETSNLDYWSATTSGPHITHNLTGNTIPGGITYPPDALNLDPSFDGRNSVLRFTAPVADTYHITGRFQGIDLTRGSTTDVAILQNSNSILTGNINGFFTDLATTPGAIVPYDLQVTLQQGETLDFSVGQGTGGSLFDSTGVSAIIVGKNWRQTAPLTKTHQITVLVGEVRKRVDFGNLELAALPPTNHSPKITSTAVSDSGVGARYRSQATATDVDGDRLTFDLPVKPAGMIVDPRTGMIVWTPTADQAGVQNVILRVSDGKGGVDLQSFQVTVASRNSGPTITSRPQGPAQANLPYQYRIRAQDAEGDAIEFSLNTPAIGNMAVDSATGVFSWLPSSSDIGSHTIEVTATDPAGDGQLQKFTLVVLASAPNRDPEILSTPREQVRLGNSYLYALDAIDPDGDPLAYRLDVAPNGLTIDGDGMMTWTPTSAQFGDKPVQVSVSDGRGGVRIQAFNIAVLSQAENHAPLISSTATLAATLGTEYRYSVQATDGDGDTLAFSLDSKPNGMSIDALSGAIRWIPTADQLGAQPIIVRVTDPQGASATQSFTVTVRGSNLPPEISSVPKTTAAVGRTYSYVLKATDPEGGPLTYSLTAKSGTMIIDSLGAIQWVPGAGEVGNVKVTVRVSDDQGASLEQSFTVAVAAVGPNLPPIITSQPTLGATVGQPYLYQVTATDPDGGPVRFAFLEVPDGMTIDESTGLIRWTSDAAGIGRVTVLVGDFDGGDAEQSFEVTVRSSNLPPQITSTPVVNTATGVTYHYDVRANDPNFDSLSFSLTSGPSGMVIDNLGRITWTTSIADAGTHRVKFTVSDDLGASAAQEYDLAVTADTEAPKVRIQVSSNPVGLSETLIIQVNATDNIGVSALDVTVDGQAVALDARGRASVLMSRAGSIRIAAVATDAAGNTGRQTTDVLVVDTSITEAPTVDVTIPAENATITAPTDVIGTVQDANLVSWKLEVAPFDGGTFTQFASGTNQVTNAKLGTFDPTLLQNDSYIVRLTALNTGGLSSSIDTVVNVSGNLKLGNFTLSFTDLSIPLAGIPITVSRTYDTLTANQDGELGYGWKLAFRDVDLRTSLPKTGDEFGGLYTPFRDGTRVYVTLPGGQREGYTFRPKAVALFDPNQRERDVGPEYQPGNGLNAAYFVPSFVPDKGVTNRLTVPRYQLTKRGHDYFQFGGGLPYNPEDPAYGARFTLTSKDGVSYRIDAATRQLITVTDLNGNTLNFKGDSVTSSAGAQVQFARDTQGRIVSITDPAGASVKYEFDSRGDLVTVVDRAGNKTTIDYRVQPAHYLNQITDPLGRSAVRTEYDAQGRVIGVRDVSGNTTSQVFDPARSLQTTIDAMGGQTSYEYDARGNVVAVTNAVGGTIRRTFDDENNVLTITDALNRTTTFVYDGSGNVVETTDPLGNKMRTLYGPNSQVIGSVDALGRSITYSLDTKGNVISSQDALGNVERTVYDSFGQPNEVTDVLGNITRYQNDAQGRLTVSLGATGNRKTFAYDANGNPTLITATRSGPAGEGSQSMAANYDARGLLTSVIDPNGVTTTSRYDAMGRVTAISDGLGQSIAYVYVSTGQLSEIIRPDATRDNDLDNPRERIAYDTLGRKTTEIDALGKATSYRYDALGRLIETIFPDATPQELTDNPRIKNEYNAGDELVAVVDERGNRTEYFYDAAGRLIETRDALGNSQFNEYDPVGNIISSKDALGRTTRFRYDDNGNRIEITYADGSRETKVYNAAGQVTAMSDALGQTTKYTYDAIGRLTAVVDALNQRTEFTYDELGNMVTQTDANQHSTRYEYDNAGRRVATILPGGQRSTTVYDMANNVAATKTFNSATIQYEYNERNWLTIKRLPDGTTSQYTYDASGQMVNIVEPSGTTLMSYDDRARLISRTEPDGRRMQYTYDASGNRTSVIAPSGTTTYLYDALNRLLSVTDAAIGTTVYTYDAVGNLVRTVFASGIIEERTYDNQNRLIGLVDRGEAGIIASYNYSLDANGRIRRVQEADERVVSYTYDPLYRLLSESIIDPVHGELTRSYTYDRVGNRLALQDSRDGTTTYEYNANDWLVTESRGSNVTQYVYDASGNMLSRVVSATDRVLLEWDAENRLRSADLTEGGTSRHFDFRYNNDGMRVAQNVDGIETRYLLDSGVENAQVVEEYTAEGIVTARYVFGATMLAEIGGSKTSFFLADGHGSTRLLISPAGLVTDLYDYDAFGRTLFHSGSSGNSYQYSGEQRDASLGLDYLRARYYSPQLGRFISRDPFLGVRTVPMSLHPYLYAHADPVNGRDPSGRIDFNLASTLKTLALGSSVDSILFRAASASAYSVYGTAFHWTERLRFAKTVASGARNLLNGIIESYYPVSTGTYIGMTGYFPHDGRYTKPGQHRLIDYLWAARKQAERQRTERYQSVGTYNESRGYILRDIEYYFVGRTYGHFGGAPDDKKDGYKRSPAINLTIGAGAVTVYEMLKMWPLLNKLTQDPAMWESETPTLTGGGIYAMFGFLHTTFDNIDGGPLAVAIPRLPKLD